MCHLFSTESCTDFNKRLVQSTSWEMLVFCLGSPRKPIICMPLLALLWLLLTRETLLGSQLSGYWGCFASTCRQTESLGMYPSLEWPYTMTGWCRSTKAQLLAPAQENFCGMLVLQRSFVGSTQVMWGPCKIKMYIHLFKKQGKSAIKGIKI